MTLACDNRPWHYQLRRLHAIGRELGLSHEDLHEACGVSSLKELTAAELIARADQLETQLRRQRKQRLAPPRLVGSRYGDASYEQRVAIDKLFGALGWSRMMRLAWLLKRHGLEGHWRGPLTIGQAHQIISQLGEAVQKRPNRQEAKRQGESA